MQSSEDSRAIFVVGSPRSGTSALAWALAQHPELATGPEMDFPYWLSLLIEADEPEENSKLDKLGAIERVFQDSKRREDGWLAKNEVSRAEFMAALGRGLDGLITERFGGKRWIDSTPAVAIACNKVGQLFPNAQFVHILRDGRATVSSMINSGFDVRVAKDFDFACKTWALYAKSAHEYSLAEPERCIEVRHEDMVADPAGAMNRVLPFLGSEPHEAVVERLQRGRINSSWGNQADGDVAKMKDHSVVPSAPWLSWSRGQRSSFLKIAGPTMESLGFELALT